MNNKQSALLNTAKNLGISILNIEEYKNKDSILSCKCNALGHNFTNSVEYLLKTNFECLECKLYDSSHIKDNIPFFLSLDAATYNTGISIFNKEGQLLSHKLFSIGKKNDFFERIKILKEEIDGIVKNFNIKCLILESVQLQTNAQLFMKLSMLQGVIRYDAINDLKIDLVTIAPDEWRSYNHVYGTKRDEQKKASIERVKKVCGIEVGDDEADSICLGYCGVYKYYNNSPED